jgi:hypothetical protein
MSRPAESPIHGYITKFPTGRRRFGGSENVKKKAQLRAEIEKSAGIFLQDAPTFEIGRSEFIQSPDLDIE